jgi:hypothetical protein
MIVVSGWLCHDEIIAMVNAAIHTGRWFSGSFGRRLWVVDRYKFWWSIYQLDHQNSTQLSSSSTYFPAKLQATASNMILALLTKQSFGMEPKF